MAACDAAAGLAVASRSKAARASGTGGDRCLIPSARAGSGRLALTRRRSLVTTTQLYVVGGRYRCDRWRVRVRRCRARAVDPPETRARACVWYSRVLVGARAEGPILGAYRVGASCIGHAERISDGESVLYVNTLLGSPWRCPETSLRVRTNSLSTKIGQTA